MLRCGARMRTAASGAARHEVLHEGKADNGAREKVKAKSCAYRTAQ
jgi:hypothetical protein